MFSAYYYWHNLVFPWSYPIKIPRKQHFIAIFLGRRYRHLVQFSEAEGGPAISTSQLFGSFIRATSPMISPISPEHFMGKFSPRHGPSTPILSATGVRIYSSTGPWRSGDGGWLEVSAQCLPEGWLVPTDGWARSFGCHGFSTGNTVCFTGSWWNCQHRCSTNVDWRQI